MNQEMEPDQEVAEETHASRTSDSIQSCNHSDKPNCSTCYETLGGGRAAGPHQCWLHREPDTGLEPAPSPQPSPAPAGTLYCRRGDGETRLKRQRRRQQRDTETTRGTHGKRGQGDESMPPGSAGPEEDLQNRQQPGEQLEDEVQGAAPGGAQRIPGTEFSTQPSSCAGTRDHVSVGPLLEHFYPGSEVSSERYESSPSHQAYEDTCTAAPAASPPRAGSAAEPSLPRRVLQQVQPGPAGYHRGGAVGSRLHHYAECSDGESDSPEKEAEFAPYPRTDSCDHDEDSAAAEVQQQRSPEGHRSKDTHQDQELPAEEGQQPGENHLRAGGQRKSARYQVTTPPQEPEPLRDSHQDKDAISLAIRDIKEAIEEVKTRVVKSPYTPEEPEEPVWVLRQDFSPNEDCSLQASLGGRYPCSDSPSPPGAESSSRHLLQDDTQEVSSSSKEPKRSLASFPTYVEVPGPCDAEDLINGIIFAAIYRGSTQLLSEKTPSKTVRMMQAREAVNRIKVLESQPMTEVDVFISTQRIKVFNADSQDTMMDHPLQTISYIADIGSVVVLMARRRLPQQDSEETVDASDPSQDAKRQYKMICHVFESEDATLIAQSIGQAFSVAYQEFLRANGINPEDLSQKEYSDLLSTQDLYNDDLVHFSKSDNCKDVLIEKAKGEILGVVIVESGWGSILPTVILANMMHAGPAERSGRLNVGDQIMSINGTSLVGLPLPTCQSIIKGLKNESEIKLNVVRCPPVTTVLIRRPDLRYQLGFSVQNGIICSLMRGGIAERGGVRVGHRIIEINTQSVVATPHEKIVHILSSAVGEIHMKTMPATMYRLLTAQEQPLYI